MRLCLAVLALYSPQISSADTNTSTTVRWKGTTPEALGTNTKFYLYNVGTGRFVMQGGDWGVQGMLLYQDYGAAMHLEQVTNTYGTPTKHYVINSGVVTDKDKDGNPSYGYYFGVNYPLWTTTGSWAGMGSYLIFNGQPQGLGSPTKGDGYWREWRWERVETSDNTTSYTYYLTEVIHNTNQNKPYNDPKHLWLGAVYGHDPNNQNITKAYVGDYTTAYYDSVDINLADPTVRASRKDSLNYQWRFVPVSEVETTLTTTDPDAFGGLNANVSYLLSDPNFDRERSTEFANWTVTSTAATSTTDLVYDWANKLPNGTEPTTKSLVSSANMLTPNTTNRHSLASLPWNTAVLRKLQVTENGRADGQYTFGSFEGQGKAEQTFTAPATGMYLVQCLGAYYGGTTPKLYAYSTSSTTPVTKDFIHIDDATFKKCTQATTAANGVYAVTVTDDADWKAICQEIVGNQNTYSINVVVRANKGDVIHIGVEKDGATQSKLVYTSGSTKQYYDTDFSALDNFSVHYTGGDAIILDEDSVSTQYMKDYGNIENRTVLLHRTFTLDKWNTFVLPFSITMAQLKAAFGDNVELARLHGVGTLTGSSTNIDYQRMEISADGNAIVAGDFYLIKPSKSPTALSYTTGGGTLVNGNYYLIGRRTFNWTNGVDEIKGDYKGEGTTKEDFGWVSCSGTYVKATCPIGSYVFSNGNMYHLQSEKTIKGFRSYLTYTSPTGSNSKSLELNLVPADYDYPTAISPIHLDSRRTAKRPMVYTIDGKVVKVDDTSLEGLPQGVYIVNGKKYSVK